MIDIIDQIDAATECGQCGGSLAGSVSLDFCSLDCQEGWHVARSVEIVDYREPSDLPQHVMRQVEEESPEVTPASTWADRFDEFAAAHRANVRHVGRALGYFFQGMTDRHAAYRRAQEQREAAEQAAAERLAAHAASVREAYEQCPDGTLTKPGGTMPPARIDDSIPFVASPGARMERDGDELILHIDPDLSRWNLAVAGWQRQILHDLTRDAFSVPSTVDQVPDEPVDVMQRALDRRRNRNTGPRRADRAPRSINPPRGGR